MTFGLGNPTELVPLKTNPFLKVDMEEAHIRSLKLLNSITISQDYVKRKNEYKHKRKDANHWTAVYIFDVAKEKKGKTSRLESSNDYFKSVFPEELYWSAKAKQTWKNFTIQSLQGSNISLLVLRMVQVS